MRLLLASLLLASAAYAQSACVESPTGYWACGGAITSLDNNALPTPAANADRVTGNNAAIPIMPTPAANLCMFFDMDPSSTTTCVLSNGTTVMHIPPLGSEVPRVSISTQTSTPYTFGATADEIVLCDATAANAVINLPAAATAGAGRRYLVKKIDATGHTCTLTPNGSEKIDGQATQVISARYTALPVVTDGSNWFVY